MIQIVDYKYRFPVVRIFFILDTDFRSLDFERTVLYPDPYVLTNDDCWTVTSETHKCAVAAVSFCFAITENGEQQDICNLTSIVRSDHCASRK